MKMLATLLLLLSACLHQTTGGVTFTTSSVSNTITEGGAVDTVALSVTGITGGTGVSYSIIGGNVAGNFKLSGNDTDLEIQLAQVISYEASGVYINNVASPVKYAIFDLTIKATDSTSMSDALHAEIKVENDEYIEVFPLRDDYTLSEKYQPGVVFHTVETAVPYNILTTYEIATDNMTAADAAKFTISPSTSNELKIATGTTWDFENGTTINVYIRVKPQTNGLYNAESYQIIEVTISDVNDNSNKFAASSYTFSVSESSAAGTQVDTVSAVDADLTTANNQTIYYVLNNALSTLFTVNSSTGVITTVGALDYETSTAYTLTVCATDNATDANQLVPSNEARSSCVPVTITITNVNDVTPQIAPATTTVISISEKIVNGSQIHKFTATDGDNLTPPVIKYNATATSAEAMLIFELSASTGVITVNASNKLDYESATKQYDLYVYAEDGDSSSMLSGLAHLQVNILDVNDNSPTFVSASYTFSVDENVASATVVDTVNAYDNDSSNANNAISYSLSVPSTMFAINASSGEITVIGSLDRETEAIYYLNVLATDNATDANELSPSQEARMGATIVQVTVNDVNDNRPVLPSNLDTITVSERVPIGRQLYDFTATDADAGNNGLITYVAASMDTTLFSLDVNTGQLTVASAFDYETATSHQVIVYAQDQGTPPLMSLINMTLTINVADVNDLNPMFSEQVYSYNVSEGTDGILATLKANDMDGSSPNNNIVYSLVDPANVGIITYSSDGNITIAANALDREKVDHYEFLLVATDNATNITERRQDSALLIINVLDVNDNNPIFVTPTSDAILVSEATLVSTSIYRFSATDADITSTVSYEKVDPTHADWNRFSLDSTTGEVKSTDNLTISLTSQTTYLLNVAAVDNGGRVSLVNATLNVTVVKVPDLDFQFTLSRYDYNVIENVVAPIPINLVNKLSVQSHSAPSLKYAIREGSILTTDKSLFSVDSSGYVFSQPLDYETKNRYAFIVDAYDSTGTYKNGSTLVVITVSDTIDVAPILYTPTNAVSINENTDIGQIVAIFNVEDIDTETQLAGGLQFNTSSTTFNILPFNVTTAYMVLGKSLDREVQDFYQVSLQVKDAADMYSNVVVINVTVTDANDNNPIFPVESYYIPVPDNTPIGTSVGVISATDNDTAVYSHFMYSIFDPAGDYRFAVNSTTGVISVAKVLTVLQNTTYPYTVTVTDMEDNSTTRRSSTVMLRIYVGRTANDKPSPSTLREDITISEKMPIGGLLYILRATDLENHFFIFEYSRNNTANPDQDYFQLSGSYIYLKQSLGKNDREHKSTYMLYFVAKELHSGLKSDEITVSVTVNDVNDNSPKFTQDLYSFNLVEHSAVDSVIGVVHSYDNDSTTANNQVTYSFLLNPYANLFAINSTSGQVKVVGDIDRETKSQYTFSIVATDNATDADEVHPSQEARSSVTILEINITDINDNRPVLPTNLDTITVSERVPIGRQLYDFTATDADAGNNGLITYVAASMNTTLFSLDVNTGQLTVASAFDYETATSHQVIVYAQDQGTPPLMSLNNMTLTINVADVNDLNPMFSEQVYSYNVSEGTDGILATLKANDMDGSSPNNNIVYSLVDPANVGIITYSSDGNITIAANALDREKVAHYEFLLVATDNATSTSERRQDSAILIINVLDVNDNKPVFVAPVTNDTVRITEATLTGTSIFRFTATDADIISTVSYAAVDPSDPVWNIFSLDPSTGSIMTTDRFNYNVKSNYSLEVKAMDDGGLSSDQNAILIVDVVDTGPLVFSMDTYRFSLSENTPLPANPPVTVSVGLSVAAMPDVNTPSSIRYYIKNDTRGIFSVNETTGEIWSKKPLDFEELHQYTFTVEATDTSHQYYNTTSTVDVHVIDQNDVAPTITSIPYNVPINEESNVGQLAAVVYVVDPDTMTREPDGLTYTLYPSTAPFNIIPSPDKTTGYLVLTQQLDRETQELYELSVMVQDNAGLKSSNFSFTITVTDANDNNPNFTQPTGYVFTVDETTALVTNVSQVTAKDMDATTPFNEVRYSILGGAEDADIHIDSMTGLIYFNNSIDYETTKYFEFTVVATDTATPTGYERKSSVPVRIDIVDVNDNSPVFTSADSFTVKECQMVNTKVFMVSASDADSNAFGSVNFTLPLSTPTPPFIVLSTGKVMLTSQLDYETQQTYALVVEAMDGGGRTTIQSVTVNVTNCNDNRPIFSLPEYAANVSEAMTPNSTVIVTVSAPDGDLHTYNEVSYKIMNPFENLPTSDVFPFVINSTTGEIHNALPLDHEARNFYQFAVLASDNGNPHLQSVVYVDINILDENDNNPVFTLPSYNVTISDGTIVGGTVVMVSASDADSGTNSKLIYGLTDPSGDFSINNETGAVYVADNLHYEQINEYTLQVTATDQGNPSRNSTSNVVIILTPIKNYPTTILELFVAEDTLNNTMLNIPTIPTLPATGTPRMYEIEFNVTDSTSYFNINSANGEVRLKSMLDYEQMKMHVFVIKVSVDGDTIGEQTVYVHVRDVNDNSPYFIESSRNQVVNISESSEIGQIVAVYLVEDADTIPALNFDFSNAKIAMSVYNNTIVLSLKEKLNAETEQIIRSSIIVNDTRFSVSEEVVVNVIDENDNSPMFYPNEYVFTKAENADLFLGTVFANDSDVTSPNNDIKYRILDSYAAAVFDIDALNGTITSKSPLDYELNHMYNFTVEAYNTDQNDDNRIGVALVTIKVTDINDNNPNCPGFQTLKFFENTDVGSTLFQLAATDPDAGENARLTYNTTSTVVSIDPVTGTVRLVTPLDFEVAKSNFVAFTVTDNGTPALQCTASVLISVLDSNDNAPYFDAAKYSNQINENVVVGTSVIQTVALDVDTGDNGNVSYAIAASYGNFPFNISQSGLITTTELLDREQKDFYQFFVAATDNGTPKLSTVVLVEVTVLDVNDNNPIFKQNHYNITLPEGTPAGFSFLQVYATDQDAGTLGEVKFIVDSRNDTGLVAFDNKTGILTTTDAITLDKYPVTQYRIALNASDCDSTSNRRYAQQMVIVDINVIPYTSPQPVFISEYLNFEIAENTMTSKIGTTLAIGPEVTYQIIHDDVNRPEARNFTVLNNGAIFSLGKFDYEKIKSFSFTIMASNKFNVNATQNVFIQLKDVEDNPPSWSMPQNQTVTISDESRVGQIVASLSAVDLDTVSHNRLQFKLKDNFTDTFRIITDQDVALIVVNKDLRFLPKDYVLCVDVADPKGFSANVSAFVEVAVRLPNLPQFTATYDVSVPENIVAFLVADVEAIGVPNIEYHILNADGSLTLNNVIFSINKNTGAITNMLALDREAQSSYTIPVIAGEAGSSRTVTTFVRVTVIDQNDNAPVFSSPTTYNISEVYPTNSLLFQLKATDLDATTNGQITYSFVNSTSPVVLQVDGTTGHVTYLSGINFESTDTYLLTFLAQDSGTPQLSTLHVVRVNVVGVNEFNPTFLSQTYSGSIVENTMTFVSPVTVQATDSDRGEAGRVTYSFVSSASPNPFLINSQTGAITVNPVNTIDYEAASSYKLLVIASDNGNLPRKSAITVTITVFDTDDNPPIFNPLIYRMTISDATPTNTEIGGVFAVDADTQAQYKAIRYEITSGNVLNKFAINETTGVIRLVNSIDYSNVAERNYILSVVGKSGTSQTSPTAATVYIDIVQSPIPAAPYFVQELLVVSYKEDSDPTRLTVNQAVNPSGGPLSFVVVNNTQIADEDKFAVDRSKGDLYLLQKLDYEAQTQHNFLVKATCTTTGLYALQSITINVLDVNDETPYFNGTRSKTISINEKTNAGQQIWTILAIDRDSVNKDDLHFRINTANVPFEIISNGNMGMVYVTGELDADINPSYVLEITVFDKTNGQLKREAIDKYYLTVVVTKNDERTPVFLSPSYIITLNENSQSFTDLGRLEATHTSSYELVGASSNDFVISKLSGALFTARQFDAEVEQDYEFMVVATNAVNNRTGYAFVRIIIRDINDRPPMFYAPFSYDVFESKSAGSYLFSVVINDTDVTDTPKTYEITSVNPAIALTINNGDVYLTGNLNYEAASKHEIVVLVRDKGNPELQASQTYTLNVINVNEHDPVFTETMKTIDVNENSPLSNNLLFTAQAQDLDAGTFGAVTYSLVSVGNVPFQVRTDGGFLVNGEIDYEQTKVYNVLILASDGGQPPRTGIMKVRVNVKDVNDNVPKFALAEYSVRVAENSPIGLSLVTVEAVDIDTAPFNGVEYKITGSGSTLFQVDKFTGVISTKASLNRELNHIIELDVSAEDATNPNPGTASHVKVRIEILDVNEKQPTFAVDYKTITIPETTPVNSEIGSVSAVDNDATFQTITYQISPNTDSPTFTLQANNGSLSLALPLNYEAKKSYEFTVIATDNGGLKGYQMVKVIVTDVNDVAPRFVNRANQTYVIKQDVSPLQIIGLLTAADDDSVSQLTMSIVNSGANQLFEIETENDVGYITTKSGVVLQVQTYILQVSVNDGQFNSLRDAYVTVIVNAPLIDYAEIKFLNPPGYVYSKNENETSGVVGTISAKIKDSISPITYRIYENNVPFSIDSNTGVLSIATVSNSASSLSSAATTANDVTKQFDFEVKPFYLFHVVADVTIANNPYSAITSVMVNILDVNDNSPQFVGLNTVDIQEDVLVGTEIICVTATDADSSVLGTVTYTINPSSIGVDMFSMDQITGKLSVVKPLDYEAVKNYTINIIATDGGQVSSSRDYVINVLDTNDNRPVFNASVYRADVVENTATQNQIICITANDADKDSVLTYELVSAESENMDNFVVSKTTGCVFYLNTIELDRETKGTYEFILTATDNGTPTRSGSTNIVIKVTDFNDNAPLFSTSFYNLQISDRTVSGLPIIHFTATDLDEGTNGQVLMSITGGNTGNVFRLSSNGTLETAVNFEDRPKPTLSLYQLTIKAEDLAPASIRRSSTITVDVQIIDTLKTIVPQFTNNIYSTTILENQATNVVILKVQASVVGDSVKYEILDNSIKTSGKFSINANGDISLLQSIDYEDIQAINFIVKASPITRPNQEFATAFVNINVADVNDNRPKFERVLFQTPLARDSKVGSVIATVKATDPDTGNGGSVRYEFQPNSLNTDLFEVNAVTGDMKLKRSITFADIRNYKMSILARDLGQPSLVSTDAVEVQVNVYPDNMHAPVFAVGGSYSIQIAESLAQGETILSVTANDADSGLPPTAIAERPGAQNFGRVTYGLLTTDPQSPFSLNAQGGIVLIRAVDREVKSQYEFYVQATDGGNPPRKATQKISVTISDVNEAPVFSSLNYVVTVSEAAPLQLSIFQVSAVDNDLNQNGQVSYTFISGNSDSKFSINTANGIITLIDFLDYSVVSQYTLKVRAVDGAATPLFAETNVVVNVVDAYNSTTPTFAVSGYEKTVPENSGSISFGLISAVRYGVVGGVSYAIDPVLDAQNFEVLSGGNVLFKGGDFEVKKVYDAVLRAYNTARPRFFSTTSIRVVLTDVNDNAPVIYNRQMSVNIDENSAVGQVVGVVHAFDKDSGNNGRLSFSFTQPNNMFSLTTFNNTGVVTLLSPLDFEVQQVYVLQVRVHDNGSPTRLDASSNAIMTVNVLDENDNNPVPINNLNTATVSIQRLLAFNSTFYTVAFIDRDSGTNGQIEYSLVNTATDQSPFYVSPNGQVMVSSTLPTATTYVLFIVAQDRGTPVRKAPFTLKVNVQNPTTTRPSFSPISYSFQVEEAVLVNSLIGRLNVIVPADAIGQLKFSIESGNINSAFEVNSNGYMVVKKPLDREQINQYTLSVSVTTNDGNGLRSLQNAQVQINVVDLNDNNPQFSLPKYELIASELSPIGNSITGQFLITIAATDLDAGTNGALDYTLIDSTDTFGMNNNGQVWLKKPLDYFVQNRFDMIVLVSDQGAVSRQSSADFTVTIMDVNERPQFNPDVYSISISEAIAVGSSVLTIKAVDNDGGPNNNVITLGIRNPGVPFTLDGNVLKVSSKVDAESLSQYQLKISATDNGNPRLSSSVDATVNIQIVSVNDNQPRFTLNTYTAVVNEGIITQGPIVTVTATDNDNTASGLTYALEQGLDSSYFRVTSVNGKGEIFVRQPLDYELKDVYTLAVTASDNENPSLIAKTTVRIIAIDVNDNLPNFQNSHYKFQVADTSPVDTIIGTVLATDADSGNNAQTDYFFVAGYADSSNFILQNNVLLLKEKVDYTKKQSYNFLVGAQDRQSSTLGAPTNVTVTVKPSQGNPPVFAQSLYNVTVYDNVTVMQVIVKVSAQDRDGGAHGNFRYVLIPSIDSPKFRINGNTGEISLQVGQSLSYQQAQRIVLYVRAVDDFGLSDESYVVIHVLGIILDTTRPTFRTTKYFAAATDRMAVGTSLVSVYATDTQSASLTYTIVTRTDVDFFVLSPDGNLQLNKKVVYSATAPTQYRLTVRATDLSGLHTLQNAEIIVDIIYVSPVVPLFEKKEYNQDLGENSPAGSVMTVKALIGNVQDQNSVQYNIEYNSAVTANDFIIGTSNGQISALRSFDREQKSIFTFTVVAFNSIQPTSRDKSLVVITITDANDNTPEFVAGTGTKTVTLDDGAPINTLVIDAEAVDKDLGTNGNVVYSLLNNNDGMFAVSLTGKVTTKLVTDFETRSQFLLTVVAQDKGIPSRSSQMLISITITNKNDAAPVFESQNYTKVIVESSSGNQFITQVRATDQDQDIVNYKIITTESNLPFTVGTTDGRITSTSALDFEFRQTYDFCIIATDSGTPSLSATTSVKIIISDANDNSPIPENEIYSATISEQLAVDQIVTTVRANDADSGANGEVIYSISAGNTNDVFKINAAGQVMVKKNLDYEAVSTYNLIISATDNGLNKRIMVPKIRLTIQLINVNDNIPVVTPANVVVAMDEGPSNRQVPVSLSVSDADGDVIKYSIISEGDTFEINADTGVMKTKVALSWLARRQYAVTVKVSDGTHLAYSVVVVNVRNVNAVPSFRISAYTFSIAEDATIGTIVGHVIADDPDSGAEGELVYSLNTQGTPFTISQVDGTITTISTLDYDNNNNLKLYSFSAQVRDKGASPVSVSVPITVNVLNVNDNNPVFSPVLYDRTADSNRDISIQLSANDGDGDSLTYSLVPSDASNMFQVNATTGILTNRQQLSDVISRYEFVARVSDGSRLNTASIIVSVPVTPTTENCGSITFQRSLYEETKAEDLVKSQTIVKVSATMQSVNGNLGNVEYFIDESTMFGVDKSNGRVFLKGDLDYETNRVQEVCVTAKSSTNPNVKASTVVRVQVTDIDDALPSFVAQYPIITIYEQTPVDTVIGSIQATTPGGYAIQYSLQDNNFKVGSSDGFIRVKRSLGVQQNTNYTLQVTAATASGTRSYLVVVTVLATNANAFSPVFTEQTYSGSLAENSTIGFSILKVIATDVDGDNITYSIPDPFAASFFSVDANGIVRNRALLDYETTPVHRFCVKASDNRGSDAKIAVATVTIQLTNVPDSVPVFKNGNYSVSIPNSWPLQVGIISVQADTVENNVVTYTLEDFEKNGLFSISAQGDISLKASPPNTDTRHVRVLASNANGQATTYVTFQFTTVSFLSNIEPVQLSTESKDTELALELDTKKFFGDEISKIQQIDIIVQPVSIDNAGDNNDQRICTYTRSLVVGCPFKAATANNVQAGQRKRRALATDLDGKLNVVLGSATNCSLVTNPNIACNGPLEPGRSYRIRLQGTTEQSDMILSPLSSPVQITAPVNNAYKVKTATDRSALNYYYIVALIVLSVLLVILVAAIAILLCYKKAGNDDHFARKSGGYYNDRVDAAKSPPQQRNVPPPNSQPQAKSFGNDGFDDNTEFSSSEHDYGMPPAQPSRAYEPPASGYSSRPSPPPPQPTTAAQPPQTFQYEPRQPSRQPSRRQETQEYTIDVQPTNTDQTYIMKRQGEAATGGPIYDTSPSQPIIPPAPPLPPAARNVTAGSTTQPRLTRTGSGRVILQHVFRR